MELIIAGIGAFATICAALISRDVTKRQKRQELNAIEKAVLDVGKTDSNRINFVAPYSIQRIERYHEINNEGDVIETYKYIGVRAYQSFNNLKIPFTVGVEGPGATINLPTVNELPNSSLTVILDKVETYTIPNLNQSYIKGFIIINGLFSPETEPVSFERKLSYK
ncbi:hypothetical protein ACFL7M_18845, partial [Thermodesulfobacteriota bacterium]